MIASVGSTPVAPFPGVVEVTVTGGGAAAAVVKDHVPPAGVAPATVTFAVNVVAAASASDRTRVELSTENILSWVRIERARIS